MRAAKIVKPALESRGNYEGDLLQLIQGFPSYLQQLYPSDSGYGTR